VRGRHHLSTAAAFLSARLTNAALSPCEAILINNPYRPHSRSIVALRQPATQRAKWRPACLPPMFSCLLVRRMAQHASADCANVPCGSQIGLFSCVSSRPSVTACSSVTAYTRVRLADNSPAWYSRAAGGFTSVKSLCGGGPHRFLYSVGQSANSRHARRSGKEGSKNRWSFRAAIGWARNAAVCTPMLLQ
jgi:hypothetical protein